MFPGEEDMLKEFVDRGGKVGFAVRVSDCELTNEKNSLYISIWPGSNTRGVPTIIFAVNERGGTMSSKVG